MKRKILIVEDDPIMRVGMRHFLISEGFDVTLAVDGNEGMRQVETGMFDLIITDLRLPYRDGIEILKKARETAAKSGVIIITGYADIRGAVEAIRDGAFDYLAKPFTNEELLISVERFFKFQKLEDEVAYLRETLKETRGFQNMIGVSPTIMDVFDRIAAVAGTDVPVLILGESGTGKELVANAIHGLSGRSGKQFVKINCAAIPENLFESELFGSEKGAFTGATESRKGKFEFADEGSIFFDEIADIPLSLQPKLLRVIEDQAITRLGSNVTVRVDVRGIYATSKNLKECVEAGTFRSDLFYRINIVPIVLPPLRERREDIPYFIDHFLKFFGEKFRKGGITVSKNAYDALLSYVYPGNVRELKHAIERAVIFCKDGVIDPSHLPDEIGKSVETTTAGPCLAGDLPLESSIRCFEKQRIMKALDETGGRKLEAARMLGISRKVLWKKLKEYGIE